MKAIRMREFGDPEVLRLEDVPEPRLGPGEIIVRVKAAGVNPVDTYIRSGTYARKPTLPYTPGMNAASIHAVLVAGLENGTLRPVVGQELPLAEAPRAHQELMQPGAYRKIVLVP
jgi:NADPH:quinone reductase-like Zn-dependent oxidoreductase